MEINLLSYIFKDFKHDVKECSSASLFLILIPRLQPVGVSLPIPASHVDGDS